ncbi:molluscan insulin-related peptide 3-like [Physella acuta]|uniref:molluscan insulin-related peptide 3-like n=1 Tax=Physella acuta TaxID=109671 RepID=UPI0027DC332E|nr:molluscan insulin-related peptide 3-like [Physella acuta]
MKVHQPSLTALCLASVLLALLHNIGVTQGGYEHTCSYHSRPHKRGLCGKRLADMVEYLCYSGFGNYMSKVVRKRNAEIVIDENLRGILLNKKEALSYLTKREVRGSITCECCYNRCTQSELLQYCPIQPLHRDKRSLHGIKGD